MPAHFWEIFLFCHNVTWKRQHTCQGIKVRVSLEVQHQYISRDPPWLKSRHQSSCPDTGCMCWTHHIYPGRTGRHWQPGEQNTFCSILKIKLCFFFWFNTWDIILENCFTFSSRTWMFPRVKCFILDWSSLHISSDNMFQWSGLRVSLKFPDFRIFQNLTKTFTLSNQPEA